MGRGETAEKLSPEEDPSTSTEGGWSRVGISPRATMRPGVDQPCGIRGSWGCGPAPPFPSPRARRRDGGGLEVGGGGHWRGGLVRGPPTAPPPPRWQGVPSALRLQRAAAAAAAAAAPALGGMGRLAGGWGVDRRLDGRWPDRQAGRRGLDKGSDGRLPIPPVLREGHPEPAIDDWGGPERVVGRVRTAGRSEKWSRRERGREEEWLDGSLTQGGVQLARMPPCTRCATKSRLWSNR